MSHECRAITSEATKVCRADGHDCLPFSSVDVALPVLPGMFGVARISSGILCILFVNATTPVLINVMSLITYYHAEPSRVAAVHMRPCQSHGGSQLAFAILRDPVRDLLFDHHLGSDTLYAACSVSAAGDRSLP